MDSNAGDTNMVAVAAPTRRRRRRRRPASATARPAHRGTTVSGTIYRDLRDDIVSLKRLREANEGWLPTYMSAEL